MQKSTKTASDSCIFPYNLHKSDAVFLFLYDRLVIKKPLFVVVY